MTTGMDAASAETDTPVRFGMDANSIARQTSAGVAPDYGTLWLGPWTLTSGWGGPDEKIVTMRDAGITPAIHFYYWGDDISADCIENGCWSSLHNTYKDRAHWNTLAQQFVDHLNAKMAGKPVVIFLETEFNKGGVATYEPLDGYLAEKAAFFHKNYPAAEVVMALGNWNSAAWDTWDRTAAASDYVGVQGLRSSVRQTLTGYMSLYESLLQGAKTAQTKFGKPIFIQDFALSTYPEPEYLGHQAAEMKEIFAGLDELKAAGVMAMVYRTWTDNPNMNTANYHGEAERHWGLAWSGNNTYKPSAKVWIDGVKAERSAPVGTTPGTIAIGTTPLVEGEAFAVKSAGGLVTDAQASGGKAWNIWSNGYILQSVDLPSGAYDLSMRARGPTVAGTGPHAVVSLGGQQVMVADPGTSYGEHVTRVNGPGVMDLKIAFTNDATSATEDRNLVVDRVLFTKANSAPVAAFSVATSGLTASFDASASSDPDGQALTYAWKFGDGATASGQKTSHTYANAGTFTASLTVSDGTLSSTSTKSVTVAVANAPPTAAFTVSVKRLTASFDASGSSDPDRDALTYAWNFGDGSTGTGRQASHSYASTGTYTVTLTVSDGRASATAQKAVSVSGPFKATFTPKSVGNDWWVETRVDATSTIAKVEARDNGGAWILLSKTEWGTYAKSINVPDGHRIEFRATSTSGATALSGSYVWS